MLRKIRITLAVLFFVMITGLFLDFTGTLHAWLGWMAKIQFLPAALALNFVVIAILVVLTLLLGRVYCSVICPLGVFQDLVSWISGRRKGKRFRFSHSKVKTWLRYGVLAVFIIVMIAGVGSFVALLDPYSAYGRIVSNLFSPFWQWGNNLCALISERVGGYGFYHKDVWIKSLPTFIVAAVTLVTVVVLAWKGGRTYCNTICPVGSVLGVLSRFSLFRPVIDAEKCRNCSLCERGCKASCIDSKGHVIDYSRCVACMDCVDVCKHDALHYKLRFGGKKAESQKVEPRKIETGKIEAGEVGSKDGVSRRGFLASIGMVAGAAALKAEEKTVDGGLATILDKKVPERRTAIVPPGAVGLSNMAHHCTGCQLCVSVCPNGVLRPSTDLTKLMQPEASYERGYCRTECTKCSEVCPTGAIRKVSVEEKSSIQIGHAVFISANCVVFSDGVECGNCARHCPAGAISMIRVEPDNPKSPRMPSVNVERCIGCGACENLCPARPFSAIYVEGHEVHRII